MWVQILLLLLKPQIWRLLLATSYLTLRQTIECRFTLKLVRDMIITFSQMDRTCKYSQHSSIIWPVWINGWVFVYELSGCGFESSCSHLNDKHIRFFTTFDLKSGNHMSKSICNIACSLALLNLWGRSNTLFQTEHTIFWTIILLLCLYNFFASLC